MAFEITKGDITIRTDSEREAQRAFEWLDGTPPMPPAVEAGLQPIPLPVGLPGPDLPKLDGGMVQGVGKLLALNPPEPQMIPVRSVLLEMLDVLFAFPEGITTKGISQLSGVPQGRVSHRLTRLKQQGLVEKIDKSINWRATSLARKAKLVAS